MLTLPQARAIVKKVCPVFKGRDITLVVEDTLFLHHTNWEDGYRNYYHAHCPDTGETVTLDVPPPWRNRYEGCVIPVKSGWVYVTHSYAKTKQFVTVTTAPLIAPERPFPKLQDSMF